MHGWRRILSFAVRFTSPSQTQRLRDSLSDLAATENDITAVIANLTATFMANVTPALNSTDITSVTNSSAASKLPFGLGSSNSSSGGGLLGMNATELESNVNETLSAAAMAAVAALYRSINASASIVTNAQDMQVGTRRWQADLARRFRITGVLGCTAGFIMGIVCLLQTAVAFKRAMRAARLSKFAAMFSGGAGAYG